MQDIIRICTQNPIIPIFLAFVIFCLIKGGKGKGGNGGSTGGGFGGGATGGNSGTGTGTGTGV